MLARISAFVLLCLVISSHGFRIKREDGEGNDRVIEAVKKLQKEMEERSDIEENAETLEDTNILQSRFIKPPPPLPSFNLNWMKDFLNTIKDQIDNLLDKKTTEAPTTTTTTEPTTTTPAATTTPPSG